MKDKDSIKKDALDFLRGNFTGTVATSNLGSEPFCSTVYFAAKDDFSIYFTTSHSTNKFKNITLNNKVAFSVGVGPEYKTFQMRGNAKILYEQEQEEGLGLFSKIKDTHPMEEWPIKAISRLRDGGSALIKITPTSATFLDLTGPKNPEGGYVYDVIP